MLIRFDDTQATIDVPDEPDFLGALRVAAADWPFREVDGPDTPVAVVRKTGGKYELSAPGEDTIEAPVVSAACSVIVDAVKAWIDAHPSRLCFHGASVLFGGRLVLFAGQFRAGKSMLVASLAARGHTIFGDDVLPLDARDTDGVATGIAPRLRVPLPENLSASLREYVVRHTAARDARYLYLHDVERLATRGTQAPLGAVVLLDRRPEGPAELFAASKGATLRALIRRNFARAADGHDILDRLHAVMNRVPRFTLRYSSLDDAAAVLEAAFARWPMQADLRGEADPAGDGETGEVAEVDIRAWEQPGRHVPLRQNPAVRLRSVDGELFLSDAEGWGIHHLNAAGAGLWRLLEQPISEQEAAEVLLGAFPEAGRERVEADVRRLFRALFAEGFVIEAG